MSGYVSVPAIDKVKDSTSREESESSGCTRDPFKVAEAITNIGGATVHAAFHSRAVVHCEDCLS